MLVYGRQGAALLSFDPAKGRWAATFTFYKSPSSPVSYPQLITNSVLEAGIAGFAIFRNQIPRSGSRTASRKRRDKYVVADGRSQEGVAGACSSG